MIAGDDATSMLVDDASHSPIRPPERFNPGVGSVSSSVSATTTQLREEKSQLKQRLRAFDLDFKAKHGRLVSTRTWETFVVCVPTPSSHCLVLISSQTLLL